MGLLDKLGNLFEPASKKVDSCASGYPDWSPSGTWSPEFEDQLIPEEYDGN